MHKKKLLLIISILLLSNFYLILKVNNLNSKEQQENLVMLANADRAIDEAVGYIGELSREWDISSDLVKMKYLGDIESKLYLAENLMSSAGKYFEPINAYRDCIYIMERKILEKEELTFQKEYIDGLNDDFILLWKFLAVNQISELTKEEAREKWKTVLEDLVTNELKHI
ncbi:hypothetical protein RI065_01555 [Mycoplasmatota bacterium zrk1]